MADEIMLKNRMQIFKAIASTQPLLTQVFHFENKGRPMLHPSSFQCILFANAVL